MNKKTTYVAQAGMIAAVYAAATLVTLMPVSYTHLTLPTICSV